MLLAGMGCAGEQTSESNANAAEHQHDHSTESPSSESQTKKPLSPRTTAMANIGDAHVHIDYSSPGVRGRVIWGGLVAYDQVWVTGAHQATSISFSEDVVINGQAVPAGTYGFFTIPGKEEWVLVLNENHEQHLADEYDESLDVLRMKVTPEQLKEPVESLTYEVTPTGENTGVVSVSWDQLKVSFEVKAT